MAYPPPTESFPRRVRVLIAYLSPFRIVEPDESTQPWSATIDEINAGNWDYVGLHEIVSGVDVGLEPPYHMVVCRDGGLALPPLRELQNDHAAVEFFNRCLCGLLLGGVYCESVNSDGLDFGSIIDWKYVRSYRVGFAAPNRFHQAIRYKTASAFDSIQLDDPRTVRMSELYNAMGVGLDALEKLDPLRGEYLLKGATGLARRDFGSALSNLWIATEQLLEALWTRDIVAPARLVDGGKSRKDQLNDTRAWSAATRIEMLFQKGIIDLPTLKALSTARKARNDLSHRGQPPKEESAAACLQGVKNLIKAVAPDSSVPFLNMDLTNHALSDPFKPSRPPEPLQPKYWMAIPKLPGEDELEREEAESRRSVTEAEAADDRDAGATKATDGEG